MPDCTIMSRLRCQESLATEITREKELWVYQIATPSNQPASEQGTDVRNSQIAQPTTVKMDVGIEDCLHIEFEYLKSRFSLKDVIVGRIYFLLVRLKIKHMELSLIRRETVGAPP